MKVWLSFCASWLFLTAAILAGGTTCQAVEPAPSIAASLQPFVHRHELAGAVTLVASKDKLLSLDAVGWADIAAKRPMKTDYLFWIARGNRRPSPLRH